MTLTSTSSLYALRYSPFDSHLNFSVDEPAPQVSKIGHTVCFIVGVFVTIVVSTLEYSVSYHAGVDYSSIKSLMH